MSNAAQDAVEALAACLCEQLGGQDNMCFCGVLVGETTIADYIGDCEDCGMAWVRVSAMYPAVGVNLPSTLPNNCNAMLGVDIEIGVLRCISVGASDGSPPTAAEMLASAQEVSDDALAMRRAVICCPADIDYVLGTYSPIGPQGGIVGGTWNLSLLVNA